MGKLLILGKNLNGQNCATGHNSSFHRIFLICSIMLTVFVIAIHGFCADDQKLMCQRTSPLVYGIVPEEVNVYYALNFSFNRDLVDIQVEKNNSSYVSNVECLIDFDAEAILPYNYSKNFKVVPMTIGFLYPKGASGIKVQVNGAEQVLKLNPDSAEYIRQNVDTPIDYVYDYDVLEFAVPWDQASILDNRHLRMHPLLNITYSQLLNGSNGEYILKYGLIALEYRVINISIELPNDVDVNATKSKPKFNSFQDNTSKYLIYMDRTPEAVESRRSLTDVEVKFKPRH